MDSDVKSRREIITVRGQSYVLRLPKFDPPLPPPRLASVYPPPPPPPLLRGRTHSPGGGKGGVNSLEDARHSSVLYLYRILFVKSPSMTFLLRYWLSVSIFQPVSVNGKAVLRNQNSFFTVPFPVSIPTFDKFRFSRAVHKKSLEKSCLFYTVSFFTREKNEKKM